MEYALGILTGLATATFFLLVLTFFRSQVERRTHIIERWLEQKGPRPTGGIFLPEDDSEIVRKEIIEKNRKQGKDTPFSELR